MWTTACVFALNNWPWTISSTKEMFLLSTLNSSLQQRAMQRSERVNDLWSAPAADVGGMEVNRDEVFSIEPRLTWRTPLIFPGVLGHCLFLLQWVGSFPPLSLTLVVSLFSLPWFSTVQKKKTTVQGFGCLSSTQAHFCWITVKCKPLEHRRLYLQTLGNHVGSDLCCSYPIEVEKGISEPSLSLFNPQY